MARRPNLQPSKEEKMTIEQIIAEWLKHNGRTWGIGPGALIAELAAHGYKIVKK